MAFVCSPQRRFQFVKRQGQTEMFYGIRHVLWLVSITFSVSDYPYMKYVSFVISALFSYNFERFYACFLTISFLCLKKFRFLLHIVNVIVNGHSLYNSFFLLFNVFLCCFSLLFVFRLFLHLFLLLNF